MATAPAITKTQLSHLLDLAFEDLNTDERNLLSQFATQYFPEVTNLATLHAQLQASPELLNSFFPSSDTPIPPASSDLDTAIVPGNLIDAWMQELNLTQVLPQQKDDLDELIQKLLEKRRRQILAEQILKNLQKRQIEQLAQQYQNSDPKGTPKLKAAYQAVGATINATAAILELELNSTQSTTASQSLLNSSVTATPYHPIPASDQTPQERAISRQNADRLLAITTLASLAPHLPTTSAVAQINQAISALDTSLVTNPTQDATTIASLKQSLPAAQHQQIEHLIDKLPFQLNQHNLDPDSVTYRLDVLAQAINSTVQSPQTSSTLTQALGAPTPDAVLQTIRTLDPNSTPSHPSFSSGLIEGFSSHPTVALATQLPIDNQQQLDTLDQKANSLPAADPVRLAWRNSKAHIQQALDIKSQLNTVFPNLKNNFPTPSVGAYGRLTNRLTNAATKINPGFGSFVNNALQPSNNFQYLRGLNIGQKLSANFSSITTRLGIKFKSEVLKQFFSQGTKTALKTKAKDLAISGAAKLLGKAAATKLVTGLIGAAVPVVGWIMSAKALLDLAGTAMPGLGKALNTVSRGVKDLAKGALTLPLFLAGALFAAPAAAIATSVVVTTVVSIAIAVFLYLTAFTVGPLLSTLVHLESGEGLSGFGLNLLTNYSAYSGPTIEGCHPIYPTNTGYITQGPHSTYSHSVVEAVDIFGNSVGAPVYSVSDGIVVSAGWASSAPQYGNWVIIRSSVEDINYRVIYGHLSSWSVTRGQPVKTGDPIGTVGGTSSVAAFTSPHLHLEYQNLPYNQCPAGGSQVPEGCFGESSCNVHW